MAKNKKELHAENSGDSKCFTGERRIKLQRDVEKLKKRLGQENSIHRALERAFTRPPGALPRLPSFIPPHTLELVAEVAVLEEEVLRLEEQAAKIRQELYREAVLIFCSKRSVENALNLCNHFLFLPKHSYNDMKLETLVKKTTPVLHKPAISTRSSSEGSATTPSVHKSATSTRSSSEGGSLQNGCLACQTANNTRSLKKPNSCSVVSEHRKRDEKRLIGTSIEEEPKMDTCKLPKIDSARRTNLPIILSRKSTTPPKLQLHEGDEHQKKTKERLGETVQRPVPELVSPNKLSEDILSCLLSIFMRISGRKHSVSWLKLSAEGSPGEADFHDPYQTCINSGKRNLGPYEHFHAIDAKAIISSRITCCSFLIQRLRVLLRKLDLVDLQGLVHEQKLAFWINIYNSCIMNVRRALQTKPYFESQFNLSLFELATSENQSRHLMP